MILIEQHPARHILERMVTCQYCGAPMETTGEPFYEIPKYVCTAKNKGCDMPDIEAEPFSRLIVRTVMNAILDENNVSKVTEIVEQEAREQAEASETMLRRRHRVRWEQEGPYWSTGGNPTKVRQYSLDLDTYLRPSNIITTRAIMESAVKEILAGPGYAIINYKLPLPPGGGTMARSSDEVQF